MISAVSSAAIELISAQITRAPSRAKSTAAALPLPHPEPIEPAPMTSAALPFSRPAILFLPIIFIRWVTFSLGLAQFRFRYPAVVVVGKAGIPLNRVGP